MPYAPNPYARRVTQSNILRSRERIAAKHERERLAQLEADKKESK